MSLQSGECVASEYIVALNQFHAPRDVSLFNRPEFFKLHLEGRRGYYFQLIERECSRVLATVHFTEAKAACVESPRRGTYAGVSAPCDISLSLLQDFLAHVERTLREDGIRTAVMSLAPAVHDPALFSCLWNILTRSGWVIARHELNYALMVGPPAYASRLSQGNFYRLKKCLREGMTARLLGLSELRAGYDLIAASMSCKGYQLSMGYDQVGTMVNLFPEETQIWGAFLADRMIGSCIAIKLARNVRYVYAWGYDRAARNMSPNILLTDALFAQCLADGTTILDIGTATLHGEPNWDLISFKRRLGMSESLKLTMQKELAP